MGEDSIASKVGHELCIIAATIAILLLFVVSSPLVLIFVIHYTLVVLIASKFRPDLLIVKGPDAWFVPEPVYSHPYTTIIWNLVCEGSISVEELRRIFTERVMNYRDPKGGLVYSRFCHTWTTFMGYYFWEWHKNFDVKHHVRLYDYNDEYGMSLKSAKSDGICCTEETLVRVAGKLFTKAYKAGTSPWELLLIPNYKSNDSESNSSASKPKTVLCFRIHHSIADGFSILGLICRLFNQSDSFKTPPEPRLDVRRQLLSLLLFPYALARSVIEGSDKRHPWHPPREQLSGENVTFGSGRIPWDQIRAIMRKYGVSSSAAVYAVSAGAVISLMKEAGLPVPKCSMAVVVPYPKPRHPGGLLNHFSGTYFTFNPQVHSGQRLLRHVGKQIRRVREGDRTADMISRFQTLSNFFPAWFWRCLSRRSSSPTFMFSNFMGPQDKLETCGIRLEEIFTGVGHDHETGIYGVMLSAAGNQRILLNVDRNIFQGARIPTKFAEHVQDEMMHLLHDAPETVV